MGSCNTTQNERSGKDMLLKICEYGTVSIVTGTSTVDMVTGTAHGLAVGDMVRVAAADLPGTTDDVTADQLYFVTAVPTTTTFNISATPGGSNVIFDTNITSVQFEFFKTIGGLRSSGMSFASEAVDITNYGSSNWREIKDAAGLKTVSISGDGVYNNTTNFKAMEVDAFASNLVCLAFLDVTAGRVYHGCFKIVSLENTGEHNGESTFTMSAESSGTITLFQAA